MRRFAELIAVAATGLLLLATGSSRSPCAIETVVFSSNTTCGQQTSFAVTSTPICDVIVTNGGAAGVPAAGAIRGYGLDAGVLSGFYLAGTTDGGTVRQCEVTPKDGAFSLLCIPTCEQRVDCEPSCSGTLTRQH